MTLPSAQLIDLRTGTLGLIGHSGIRSGIAKLSRSGPVTIGLEGPDGDAHAETFHGGREKAVLQYDADHYASWAAEFPGLSFPPGSFGENFLARGMTEANMHVGDIVSAGTAVLQVSESRQPCFKLNHRFGDPGIAARAQATGRTGWLYRVLQPGVVQSGDLLQVVERPLPDWPIARLQHYLYHDTNLDMARVLADLPHLSPGFRSLFARRVERGAAEDWADRLSNGPLADKAVAWTEAVVTNIGEPATGIRTYQFRRVDGQDLSTPPSGAHVSVKVQNAWTRSYSLIPAPQGVWAIAVKREDQGRGASRAIHAEWVRGTRVLIGPATSHFPLAPGPGPHVFVAGGIGITPFLSLIEEAEARGEDWRLHYAFRDQPAFMPWLSRFGSKVGLHGPGNRLELDRVLACPSDSAQLYGCGPRRMMEALRVIAESWPRGQAHFEAFAAETGTEAFEADYPGLPRVTVTSDETLLTALRRAGATLPSQCETGTCGTCTLRLVDGTAIHRDLCLTRAEQVGHIVPCVSRGTGLLRLGPG